MSGTICPLAKLYDNHFSEYQEPSTWKERVDLILEQYRTMRSKQSMYRLIGDTTGKQDSNENEIVQNECAEATRNLLNSSLFLMQNGIEQDDDSEFIELSNSLNLGCDLNGRTS